jgi:cell filamentation protein
LARPHAKAFSQAVCGLEPNRQTDYLKAMRESVADSTHIKALVQPALTTKINDREMFMKGIDYSYYYEQND